MCFFIVAFVILLGSLPFLFIAYNKRRKLEEISISTFKDINNKLLLFEIVSILFGMAFCLDKIIL